METAELLTDAFGRVRELYVETARDLDPEAAHRRLEGTGNPVAWLLWHTARVQDDHVADLAGVPQAWHTKWAGRFDLPFDEGDIGYGHSSAEVDAVRIERLQDLVDYHEAVHQLTLDYLARVDADELDRVVDDNWDPPVTAGVRVVSLLGDCLQHLGQAAYVKGLPG
ncbi:MAG: DinB family protein [Marmoricola sp.]